MSIEKTSAESVLSISIRLWVSPRHPYRRVGACFVIRQCQNSKVIAMGLPTENFFLSLCRNPLREVARFFDTKHTAKYVGLLDLCGLHKRTFPPS